VVNLSKRRLIFRSISSHDNLVSGGGMKPNGTEVVEEVADEEAEVKEVGDGEEE
jgi:hypothetical protein